MTNKANSAITDKLSPNSSPTEANRANKETTQSKRRSFNACPQPCVMSSPCRLAPTSAASHSPPLHKTRHQSTSFLTDHNNHADEDNHTDENNHNGTNLPGPTTPTKAAASICTNTKPTAALQKSPKTEALPPPISAAKDDATQTSQLEPPNLLQTLPNSASPPPHPSANSKSPNANHASDAKMNRVPSVHTSANANQVTSTMAQPKSEKHSHSHTSMSRTSTPKPDSATPETHMHTAPTSAAATPPTMATSPATLRAAVTAANTHLVGVSPAATSTEHTNTAATNIAATNTAATNTAAKPIAATPVLPSPALAEPTKPTSVTANPVTETPNTAQSSTATHTTASSTAQTFTTGKPPSTNPIAAKPTTATPITTKPIIPKPNTTKHTIATPIAATPIASNSIVKTPEESTPAAVSLATATPSIVVSEKGSANGATHTEHTRTSTSSVNSQLLNLLSLEATRSQTIDIEKPFEIKNPIANSGVKKPVEIKIPIANSGVKKPSSSRSFAKSSVLKPIAAKPIAAKSLSAKPIAAKPMAVPLLAGISVMYAARNQAVSKHPIAKPATTATQSSAHSGSEPPMKSHDVIFVDGQPFNNRGYRVCGVANQRGRLCGRIGTCPFHSSQKRPRPSEPVPHPRPSKAAVLNMNAPPQKARFKRSWTPQEHRIFLRAMRRHGKGKWKEIAGDVGTRTANQCQSHAQKYFLRLAKSDKERKKKSIHDIHDIVEEEKGSEVRLSPQTIPKAPAIAPAPTLHSMHFSSSQLGIPLSVQCPGVTLARGNIVPTGVNYAPLLHQFLPSGMTDSSRAAILAPPLPPRVRVTVHINGSAKGGMALMIPDSLEIFFHMARGKLKTDRQFKRIFTRSGVEITCVDELCQDDMLWLSAGEEFLTPK